MKSREHVKPDGDDTVPDLFVKEIHHDFTDIQLKNTVAPLTELISDTNDGHIRIKHSRRNVCDATYKLIGFDNKIYRRNFIQTACIFVNFLLLVSIIVSLA